MTFKKAPKTGVTKAQKHCSRRPNYTFYVNMDQNERTTVTVFHCMHLKKTMMLVLTHKCTRPDFLKNYLTKKRHIFGSRTYSMGTNFLADFC